MVKTTFLERFEKTNKFFDKVYHHHKATFKGMAQFFQNYSQIQKKYANSILYQSQTSESFIPDLKQQQPSVIQGIKEMCTHLQKVSQLHYNFGQRLQQIGMTYQEEYIASKKKKEKFMKQKFEKNEQAHDKAKSTKDRSKLQNKEKQICKDLFQGLDEYMQDQVARSQKLKQQTVIYFSLEKKIAQRKIQLSNGNNLKMSQFNVYVKVNKLPEIQQQLVEQYNGYSQDKLVRKNRDLREEVVKNLQLLRSSIMHRDKAIRMEQNMNKMQEIIYKYQNIPQELNYPHQDDYLIGIFDKRVIPNYKQFSRQFKSQALRQIAFAWLSSHYSADHDSEAQSLLTVAKVNLKVRQIKLPKAKDIKDFIARFMQKAEQSHKKTLSFLIQISQVYEGTLRMVELEKALSNNELTKSVSNTVENPIHWKISLVFVDSLLDSVIINQQDYSVLYDEYVEILELIVRFAKMTFDLPATIVISMFLRKLKRVLQVTMSTQRQRIQELLVAKFDLNDEFSQTEQLKMHICHRLIHFLTTKMTTFYKNLIDFSNLVKLSLAVEKVLPKNYFTTMEHLHSCIKIAGFNFFHDHDEDNRVTQGLWTGQERLKNLTFALEGLELDKVNRDYIQPMAKELSKLLGVGYPVVVSRMKKQFMAPIFQIIQCSLDLLNQTSGVDKEGYVLKLGIKLALLDVQQPQPISNYIIFFKVLQSYLTSTEKDYDQLLQYARKTELWIVEQNSQATQNCIDFCSLLYKPFQFLLISLKKLEQQHQQTEFITKYSEFIKYKLNSALKGQIQKYVSFLDQSLNNYHKSAPVLALKYKRLPEPYKIQEDKQQKFTFRQITRRLFNLIFLKDQLDELICDFVDQQIYQQLNRSIFHLSELEKAAVAHPGHEKILLNILGIAKLISQTQKDLISKIAHVTVFHFMRKIFANLYYQEEKGFFSSDSDYKLSEYTFQTYQSQLEQLMLTISRNMPQEVIDDYSKEFCRCLFLAYRCEVLDANKFKIPIKKQKIINYLQTDLNFFCNLAKHKFMSPECVKQHFEDPCHRFIQDLEQSSSKLMECFSEANVKNDNEQIRYYLAVLNLRKEDKAQEFVQKYKKFMK